MNRFLRSVVAFALVMLSANARTTSESSKRVHVRQYTRKDGTVVSAHNRSLPGATATRPLGRQPTSTNGDGSRIPTPRTRPTSAGVERDARGRLERSTSAKHAFETSHPCPATGRSSGPCKGYVIDHVKPLACGGADSPSNMQWQTETAAKLKDRTERAGCATR